MTQRPMTKLQMIQNLAFLGGLYGLSVRSVKRIVHEAVGKTDRREQTAAFLAYSQGCEKRSEAPESQILPRTSRGARKRDKDRES